MSFKSYVYAFLLGGILVPTAAVTLAIYYIFTYYSVPYTPAEAARKISSFVASDDTQHASRNLMDVKTTPEAVGTDVPEKTPEKPTYPAPKRHVRPLSGWMIVRRDFHGKDATERSGESVSPVAPTERPGAVSGTGTPVTTAGASMGTAAARYSNMIRDSYLSFARGSNHPTTTSPSVPSDGNEVSSSPLPTPVGKSHAKPHQASSALPGMQERVFAVLKGKVLFLYSDDTRSDCLGALDVEAFSVGISRGDDEDEDGETDGQGNAQKYVMREGELFSKRNAIILRSVPRLEDDHESSPSSKRRSRSGLKRSNSTRSVRSDAAAMHSLTPSMGTAMKKPVITRKSTPASATELKHMSDAQKARVDGSDTLPPVLTSLTKNMDDGTSGVPIPGQDQLADAAEARDKTMLEVEEEEKEKRRKEKMARENRRTRIEGRPWYLFLRNNIKMEEWYLSLLSISTPTVPSPSALDELDERTRNALEKLTARPGVDEIFSKENMKNLIDKLNTDPDQGNVRWLNGLVGRLFLGICRTVALEAFIIERVMKKINRAKFPSWIEYIRIDEVDVGDVPPIFSKPMLKEMTEDGAYAADVHLNYEGEFRLKVSAAGSFSIRGTNLGRAKAQLHVRILSIQGNLRIKINKAPSNRIWWRFSENPQIVMHVEPILASRKMQLSALTRAIEKQIREGIAEACVIGCDDIPFFDTSNLRPRGGIFDVFGKKRGPGGVPISTEMTAEGLEAKPLSIKKTMDSLSRHRSTSLSAFPPSMSAEALDIPLQSSKRGERDVIASESTPPTARLTTDGASTASIAKSLTDGTKKWFSGHANSGDTLDSDMVATAVNPGRVLDKHTHQDPDLPTVTPVAQSEIHPDIDQVVLGPADTATSHQKRSSPQGKLVMGNLPTRDPPTAEPTSDSMDIPSLTEQGDNPPQPAPEITSQVDQGASSLIDTIRSRAKDKQALQTSVNQAKDAMRKWGTNWAAKRSAPLPTQARHGEETTSSPSGPAVEKPKTTALLSSAIHQTPEPRPMDIPRAGLSLQERLANVTQLATSPDRKPRRSTESHGLSLGGYRSQSLDEDEVGLPGRPGDDAHKQPLPDRPISQTGTHVPKTLSRPGAARDRSPASVLMASTPPSEPEAAPPLPPRMNRLSIGDRTALETPASSLPDPPIAQASTGSVAPPNDDPSVVVPPPLPVRPITQHSASGSKDAVAGAL